MRLISGWLGICCTVIGILSIVFQYQIPPEANILNIPDSILLTIFGVLLMYIGREYLPIVLGYILGSDDNSDS